MLEASDPPPSKRRRRSNVDEPNAAADASEPIQGVEERQQPEARPSTEMVVRGSNVSSRRSAKIKELKSRILDLQKRERDHTRELTQMKIALANSNHTLLQHNIQIPENAKMASAPPSEASDFSTTDRAPLLPSRSVAERGMDRDDTPFRFDQCGIPDTSNIVKNTRFGKNVLFPHCVTAYNATGEPFVPQVEARKRFVLRWSGGGGGGGPRNVVATMAAAAFRFYNAALKANVYDKCPIPTKQSPSAGSPINEAKESQYTGYRVCNGASLKESAFSHRSRQLSAAAASSTREELSAPFAPRGVAAGATGGNSVKRRKRELEGLLRVYKVRMFPTAEQKVELKRTFSAVRRAYNATVASVNAGSKPNFYERRKEYADSQKPGWAQGVSTRIIAGGVEAAVNAYKTNFAKMKVNSSHTHFQVRFMSHKKTKTEVVRIDAKSASAHSPLNKIAPVPYTNSKNRAECLAFFGNNLKSVGGIRLQDTDKVIQKMLAEGKGPKETCRIRYDKRTEAFHFLYTHEIPRLEDPDPEFEAKRVVATDPGARRFQTYYSPTSGEYGVLLSRQKKELEERCRKLDERASWLAKRANCYSSDEQRARRTRRQRRNTFRSRRRKLAKERAKLHEWMTRAHYDSANFLLDKYDVVISPKLETAKMVPRDGRVFGCKTARAMLTWSHGLFAQRLGSASARYPGRCVITDSGEPGTSKTCTHCGHWNANLGGSSIYHCAECGISVDRDVAGARNNFLAAIGAAMGVGWDGNSD